MAAPSGKPLAVALEWIEAHCVVPDGFRKGAEFRLYDFQLRYMAAFYTVRHTAAWRPDDPVLGPAFVYRRGMLVAPQKALALTTPIPTPLGWSTMGELQPGDRVFDEQGRPTQVLSKSQVWNAPTYRVTFSDGASLVTCGDHQWWVERRTPSATYVEDRVRTEDLIGELRDKHGACRFRVPVAGALELPDADLPVDPYVLGAWLGDGTTGESRLTGLDREVFDQIAAAGYEVRQMKVAKRVNVIGLMADLRRAGVLKRKHIPEMYLRSSAAQRWALLQGLMDTDGYADERQGRCEFTTTLPELRDGFRDLLHTLGIKHVTHEGVARLNGRATGPKWRISFGARADMPVFHLRRKQDRLKPSGAGHAQYRHRRIVSVEPIETVPTQCLTVEADSHVFLAGREMIPTCNTGKGPLTASQVALEGLGPALFAGWAGKDDGYACADFGCGCDFEYPYEPGEPMGMSWPTPLIQLTAVSEEQVGNVADALKPMISQGPLASLCRVGEEFIRLPNDGRIDFVTSSAQSRLGQRVTFVAMDEVGLWTATNKMTKVADTQFRGLAGMGGRASLTTNAWDPAEQSLAQREYESSAKDVYRQFLQPPKSLSYSNKADRRKIHRLVYEDALKERGGHVDLDSIEAEAADLLERDPGQAQRFFGNRLTVAAGTWLPDGLWAGAEAAAEVPDGTLVAAGFDGSEVSDWTAIRLETVDGYRFTPTYGPDKRPTIWNPDQWGGRIPRAEVHAAWDEICRRYRVLRAYCDPRDWQSEIGDWSLRHGEKVFVEWATNRITQMHAALERSVTDLTSGRSTHDGCPLTTLCVGNARKAARPGDKYILTKPSQQQKIDAAMADALAHEAAADAHAGGDFEAAARAMLRSHRVVVMR